MATYYHKKIALLTTCLRLSEDFLTHVHDVAALEDILSERNTVLHQIKELEDSMDKESSSCSDAQKFEIIRIVNLITAIDRDVAKIIQRNQQETLESIKSNVKGRQISRYSSGLSESSGTFNFKR